MTLSTQSSPATTSDMRARLYRMLWRWHFYAGLFCMPFVVLLSLTGSIYLYKPQVEAWLDRPYASLTMTGPPALPSQHVAAALATQPGSVLKAYELPLGHDDAVKVTIAQAGVDHLVYVHPQSLDIVKSLPSESRFMAVVRTLHGELLMGDGGSLLVELAASWGLVMLATGLYLWWPRTTRGLAGIVWPRLDQGSKILWRDVHSVTGIWVSFFAFFLILTGLPWANVWGDAFKAVREVTGTAVAAQDWSSSRSSERRAAAVTVHASHGEGASFHLATIDDIVADARTARLQPPVLIRPPGRKPDWVAESTHPNRMWRQTLVYDKATGARIATQDFSDKHVIDQAVGIGIAAHEGQLFGLANQILGTATALGLILLSISAFIMWRKRAPMGGLGAPPAVPDSRISAGLGVLILAFGLFLPVLGASLVLIALIERLILVRLPRVRAWLGFAQSRPSSRQSEGLMP